MQHEAHKTTDHDTIKQSVKAREGRPAAVAQTHEGDEVGVIRIAFAEPEQDEGLEDISWEEFFEKFEENNWRSSIRITPRTAPPAASSSLFGDRRDDG